MAGFAPTNNIDMTSYGRQEIDVRIQVSVPAAGIFTLGQSELNSTDVLGSTYQWDVYTDELVQINHSVRSDMVSGIFFQPQAATASVTVRTPDLNPNVNPDIHPNTRMKVDWKPKTSGTWSNLITGYVVDVNTLYNQDAAPVTTLVVEDFMSRLMNAPITSFVQSSNLVNGTLATLFSAAVTSAGLNDGVYVLDDDLGMVTDVVEHGALSYSNTTAGEIFNDLLKAELGWIYFEDQTLRYVPRDWWPADAWFGSTTDFDSFETAYNVDYLFSDIYVSLTSAPSTVYRKTNTDVSSFFGSIAQTTEVNLVDSAQLNKWMESIINVTPGLRVSNFSIPKFVPVNPRTAIDITNDVAGQSNSVRSNIIESTIYLDATSVSTSMQLYQPV